MAWRVRSVMLSTNTIDFEREEFLDAAAGIDAARMLVMLRAVPGVRIGRRIGAADQHGDVAEVDEAADRDAVARPVLDRLHAGLEIEADGLIGRQRLAAARSCRRPAGRRSQSSSCCWLADSRSSAVTMRTGILVSHQSCRRRRGVDRAPKDCLSGKIIQAGRLP